MLGEIAPAEWCSGGVSGRVLRGFSFVKAEIVAARAIDFAISIGGLRGEIGRWCLERA
jgi:hypothetical protein